MTFIFINNDDYIIKFQLFFQSFKFYISVIFYISKSLGSYLWNGIWFWYFIEGKFIGNRDCKYDKNLIYPFISNAKY